METNSSQRRAKNREEAAGTAWNTGNPTWIIFIIIFN